MRVLARWERPHPGAQLRLTEADRCRTYAVRHIALANDLLAWTSTAPDLCGNPARTCEPKPGTGNRGRPGGRSRPTANT